MVSVTYCSDARLRPFSPWKIKKMAKVQPYRAFMPDPINNVRFVFFVKKYREISWRVLSPEISL